MTTKPPQQRNCTSWSTCASTSARKLRHGSVGSFGIRELLRREAGQQIPMLRLSRPTFAEPASLGLGHRLTAERILACQSRRLQPSFDGGEGVSGDALRVPFGNLARKGDDEPEAVLEIVEFCLGDKPIPIEARVLPDHPRQRLSQTRLEIGSPERGEQQLRRIDAPARLEVCESWIVKGRESLDKALCVLPDAPSLQGVRSVAQRTDVGASSPGAVTRDGGRSRAGTGTFGTHQDAPQLAPAASLSARVPHVASFRSSQHRNQILQMSVIVNVIDHAAAGGTFALQSCATMLPRPGRI